MRATLHNGRVHKNGSAFNSKHNDRSFDLDDSDNISADRSGKNRYWNTIEKRWYSADDKKMTFEQVERDVCYELVGDFYEQQQERHRAHRQTGRLKSFDDWLKQKNTCPEECHLQIGNVAEHVDARTLSKIACELLNWQVKWSKSHGEPFEILDASFHFDESVPHLQFRRYWTYVDDDGIRRPGQEKALEKIGVGLPDESKKRSRYNNRKMTFDREIRRVFLDICEKHGVYVEREPLVKSKPSLEKDEYLEQRARKLEKESKDLVHRARILDVRESEIGSREKRIEGILAGYYAYIDDYEVGYKHRLDNIAVEPEEFSDFVDEHGEQYNRAVELVNEIRDYEDEFSAGLGL